MPGVKNVAFDPLAEHNSLSGAIALGELEVTTDAENARFYRVLPNLTLSIDDNDLAVEEGKSRIFVPR